MSNKITKIAMNTVANTNQANNIKELLSQGEIVHDLDTGYCYCKSDYITNKYSIITNEEDAPCLGSECPKRDECFKYNESKKFSEENFIMRDLSIEKYKTDFGWETYCCASNRYRHFRWND